MMKKNMGLTDRILRIGISAALVILYFTDIIRGTAAVIILMLAGVLLLTSLIGSCPLYLPFGICTGTCGKKEEKKQ